MVMKCSGVAENSPFGLSYCAIYPAEVGWPAHAPIHSRARESKRQIGNLPLPHIFTSKYLTPTHHTQQRGATPTITLLSSHTINMDAIQAEFDRLDNKSNLSKAVTDIDKCIALLENARNQIAQGLDLFSVCM